MYNTQQGIGGERVLPSRALFFPLPHIATRFTHTFFFYNFSWVIVFGFLEWYFIPRFLGDRGWWIEIASLVRCNQYVGYSCHSSHFFMIFLDLSSTSMSNGQQLVTYFLKGANEVVGGQQGGTGEPFFFGAWQKKNLNKTFADRKEINIAIDH